MFKNLNPSFLGVTGHQSEIIELALTYGFAGMDLDVADFATRARLRGMPYARRLIDKGWYEPTVAKFKKAQPTGPWLIGCYDGDKPTSGCLINVFDDTFRDWAIERNAEGLRLELVA